ncbi:hypothetical protein ES705_06597 [subsurface metagenome]
MLKGRIMKKWIRNLIIVAGAIALLLLAVFGTDGIGSNNWVISGKRTKSGKPLLANDMHLGIQMPSVWYEIGLHGITEDGQVGRTERCPFHLRGFSFPGVFGVIAGHNDRIAWGLTNLAGDVQDLYIERINPSDPDQYEVNGEWVDMDIIYEEIEINKEEEPYRMRVRYTRHGPVMTDLKSWDRLNNFFVLPETKSEFPENMGFTVLTLRWTALEPGTNAWIWTVPRLFCTATSGSNWLKRPSRISIRRATGSPKDRADSRMPSSICSKNRTTSFGITGARRINAKSGMIFW